MDELLENFISEVFENLQSLDNQLVELEHNPYNELLLANIFRIMHTIKGTCGFLNLVKLEAVAHAGENVMDKIRNKEITVNSNIISIILETIDTIRIILNHLSTNETEPDEDYNDLITRINLVANKQDPIKLAEDTTQKLEDKTIKNIPVAPKGSNQTIRVNVDVLENLMQIASELVLNRNQLIQIDKLLKNTKLSIPVQRLNTITSSLQETMISTRMQAISNAWVQIPRLVRDLSKELNKQINLVMLGKETELDRQLIEKIKDPLMHMIRNSADHGLETPSERKALGKPLEGTITLNAYHQAGHINIEVSDDGKGINVQKVKEKLIKNKLVSEEELKTLTYEQICNYIFNPGFSTAEVVTNISGRGVGMDVVENNINEIRGTVELKSVPGKGTKFIIKIPLTLAIMPILIVESGGEKFGIPQLNIFEIVRVNQNSEYLIEEINNNKILRIRESLLPLVNLAEILKLNKPTEKGLQNNSSLVVICEAGGHNFGLIVDKIFDMEEIVLKPVSGILKSMRLYSGNTMLGNGDVIMILDLLGIEEHISSFTNSSQESLRSLAEINLINKQQFSRFLTIKCGNKLKAIPLELVSRLELIEAEKVEATENRQVVQYLGSLMFLAFLNPQYKIPKNEKMQIIVFLSDTHILGLVVDEIIDIVECDVEDNFLMEEGDLNAIVVGGVTLELVDINYFFKKIFFNNAPLIEKLSISNNIEILVVDDSNFFLKFITRIFTSHGFKITSVTSPGEAINILEKNKINFNVIITDINMPEMTGLEFAKFCMNDQRFKHIPIIAATANADIIKKDILKKNGIKYCFSKTSYDEIIRAIYSIVNLKEQH